MGTIGSDGGRVGTIGSDGGRVGTIGSDGGRVMGETRECMHNCTSMQKLYENSESSLEKK